MIPETDFYKNLLDHMFEGVYAIDLERRIIFWNKAAERLTGYKASEVVGTFCREQVLMHLDNRGNNLCKIRLCPAARAIQEETICEEELYLHHKEGHRVPVISRIVPLRDPKGTVIGAIELFRDNSTDETARQKIQELQNMALLDPLTELGNRRHAETHLERRLNELKRHHRPFGVIFADIDYFKQINDRYGHDSGDRVLKMVAKTLANSVRSIDTVSRWGGEEFLALLTDIHTPETLFQVAHKCRVLVQESVLNTGAEMIYVTISIGATMARPDETAETLFKRADRLMYQSKTGGGNRVTVETG